MALSGYKFVLFFQNQGSGWSETYFNAATDATTADTRCVQLVQRRQLLLAQPAQLTARRLSLEVNPRASNLTQVAPLGTWPYTSESDQVSMTCLLRLYSSGQNRSRAVYMRGIPDGAFDLKNPSNPDAGIFNNAFLALGSFLQDGNNGFTVKYGPRLFEQPTVDITDWVADTPSTNTTVTGTAIVASVGDAPSVQVYGVRGLPFAPGRTKVVFADPTAPTELVVRYRTPPDFVYQGGGKLMPYVPNYDQITRFAGVPKFVRRATGRPSGLSRGRRRSIAR